MDDFHISFVSHSLRLHLALIMINFLTRYNDFFTFQTEMIPTAFSPTCIFSLASDLYSPKVLRTLPLSHPNTTFFSNPFKPLPSQTSFSPRAYYFYECHHYVLSHALHLWFDPFVWILCIEVTAGSPISTFHYHFHDHYSNSGTCLPSPGTLYICLLIDLPACSLVFYESPISLKCIIITSISRDFNLTDSEKCLELSFSISTSGESNGPGITFWKAYLQRQLPNL